MEIPKKGLERGEIFAALESYRANDLDWRDGRTWAYVYDAGGAAEDVSKSAFMMYLTENGLDPTVFPSTMELENEVVRMIANHMRGDEEVVGSFTTGGTESVFLALKTARDRARVLHPEIERPEIVLPYTAHACFQKSCHLLCIEPVLVDVDPETYKADVSAMAEAITENTIMLVGSAVSYAHGVIDPIPELGQLALENDLLLHVDGCIGGFILQYFRRFGADVTPFDFTVPGVTSISVDLHKYGFAPKPASVVLQKDAAQRKHQIYACATWSGYTIINNTMLSSKSAGPLAAAWATLRFIGDEGYAEMFRSVYDATQAIVAGLGAIPELRVLGKPESNLVAFTSDEIGVFHLADEMKQRGWYVQPQLASGNSPENIHLSINPASVPHAEALLDALRESIEAARELAFGQIAAMVRDAFAGVEPEDMTDEMLQRLLGMAGIDGGGDFELPERMAEINEILNALEPRLREPLLVNYVNELYQ